MKVLLLLLVSLVLACAKLALVLHESSPTRVPGEYIVVVRSELGPEQLAQHIDNLVADFATSSGTFAFFPVKSWISASLE